MNKKIIHTVFEDQAAKHPEKVAIVEEANGQSVNYSELNQFANRIAHRLLEHQLQKEEIVGVYMSPGIGLSASFLGILKAGGVYLPIDVDFESEKLETSLSKGSCSWIITEVDHLAKLKTLFEQIDYFPKAILVLKGNYEVGVALFNGGSMTSIDFHGPSSKNNPDITVSSDQGSYVLYTSGTTGQGKSFMGTQKGLAHFLHWEAKEFGIGPDIRTAALSQITFDASLRDILLPLAVGGTLYIPSKSLRYNTAKLVEWLSLHKINLIHCVPSIFRLLSGCLRSVGGKNYLHDMRYIIMAGEQLFGKDIIEWREVMDHDVKLINLYGTSETTMAKTFHIIGEIPAGDSTYRIPAGKPISNTIIAVIKNDSPCMSGEIGEIYIKTPFTTKGYLDDELLNASHFVQNPLNHEPDIIYRTGDFGRWNSRGDLEILGRTDDQVKVNGIRVRLTDVETDILLHADITETVVVAHKNKFHENILLCYYTSKIKVDTSDLAAFATSKLASGTVPAFFHQLDTFPLTINGKVDKRALPKPELIIMKQGGIEGPVTEIQQIIHDIWTDVLNLDKINITASFFEIGGTSLQAIQVISKIYHDLKKEMVLTDIFKNPTIEKLAILLDNISEEAVIDIEPVKSEEVQFAISHAQKRLWITDQMNGSNDFYNMPDMFVLEGEVDIVALKKTFFTLANRHESLRTNFLSINGSVAQKIRPQDAHGLEIPIEHIGDVPDKELLNLASLEGSKPFDLELDMLFQVKLFSMRLDKVACFINMHHIISDGWSLQLLIEETKQIYNAYVKDSINPLPPLKLQYKDYAAWQNKQILSGAMEPHKNYWLRKFEGDVPRIELPGTNHRGSNKMMKGAHMYFELEKAVSKGLNDIALKHQTTLLPVLMGAVKTLLHILGGQRDLVIGTPITSRKYKSMQTIVGNFVNLLPIRSQIHQDQSFDEYASQLGTQIAEAYSHESYPFDMLVSDLQADLDSSRSPLFDILVQLQDERDSTQYQTKMTNLEVKSLHAEISVSKFDLTFNFTVGKKGVITIALEYDTHLYDDASITKMKDQFVELCNLLLEEPGIKMKNIKKATLDESQIELKETLDMQFGNIEIEDTF